MREIEDSVPDHVYVKVVSKHSYASGLGPGKCVITPTAENTLTQEHLDLCSKTLGLSTSQEYGKGEGSELELTTPSCSSTSYSDTDDTLGHDSRAYGLHP